MNTRTVPFRPTQRRIPPLQDHMHTLESPLKADEKIKAPILLRLIPVAVVVLVVVMIVLMVSMGRRMFSPMMLMMPAMLLMGMLGMTMHGGAGGNSMAEVDVDRKNWLIQIRELRHQVQNQGRRIHALAVANFPNPSTLTSLTAYRRQWQVRESNAYMEALANSKLTQFPFMTVRAGVGMAPLEPAITFDPQEVPENLEPVTASAFSRFLRTQQYVTNIPIGIRLNEERAYGLRGDEEGRLDLSRAFITSLAFNHTPAEVAIGVITDLSNKNCAKEWDWVKWFPHNQDYDMAAASGMPPTRFAWKSMQDYTSKMAHDIAARTTQGSEYEGPNMVIFVDLPDEDVSWPVNIIGGVPGVVFVVVRFASDSINHYDDDRVNVIAVDENGLLSVPGRRHLLTIDRIPRRRAENFARSQARWRPSELGRAVNASATEAGENDLPSWFDALGIPDIDSYDPRVVWSANAYTETFRVPLGYKYDGKNRTPDLQFMDLMELSRGGTGPHGCLQGKTGTGKSYLLNNLVLTMCAMYGPDKVSFILADFKAGAAFDGFEPLPHVIAVLTNLETQKEMVDRAGDVIDGEISRRENFLFQYKAKDILDYRKMQRADPSLPPLPDLFVIADEFHEFMHNNRSYLKLFTRIGAKGRSLGMHILPCSQFIDTSLLQDLMNHLTVGISLTASSASYSRAVLDGNPGAAQLPAGGGHAMIRYVDKETQENRVDTFVGFAIEDPYISKVRTEEDKVSARREMEDTALPFGLFATSAEEHKKPKTGDTAKKRVTETKTDRLQKWALIEHLCKFQEVQAPNLWQESLMVPMSLANIKTAELMAMRTVEGLHFRLGDLDDPLHHSRPPYIISPDSNIGIFGRSKSGKTMTIMAMMASAALVYQGDVAWYLINYAGGGLEAVEAFPTVGGYATKADTDHIERYLGEMYNVLDYREQVMAATRTPRFADYLSNKKVTPDPRDPYGYMMLVIDGYDSLILEDDSWKTSIMRLLMNGPRHGIRVVVTSPDVMTLPIKQQGQFPTAVVLGVDDASRMGTSIDSHIRQRVKLIPEQPGRGIDPRTGKPSLIFVPKFEEIAPLVPAERGRNAVYNYTENHGAGIAALGEKLAGRIAKVKVIDTVPHKVPYADLWEAFSAAPGAIDPNSPLRDRWLPLGVDTRTLVPVLVPKNSPHMLVAGAAKSGRTTLARTVITSVVNQYKSSEAKFVLIDPDYALMNEMEHLVRDGYMKPGNYASSREESRGVVEGLKKLLAQRMPRKDMGLTPRDIRERSWFKGPEIFVIVDGYNRVGSQPGTQGPIDELVPFLQSATDLGVHMILTTSAVGIGSQFSTNKMYKLFIEQAAPVLMLSGPANEPSITPMKVKFEDRRAGFGKFVLAGESKIVQTQVAYTEPWESFS